MSHKIVIDTETLYNQANQLETCVLELETDLTEACRQIGLINDCTSFSMRMGMAARTAMLKWMVQSLEETMQTGVNLARQCADEFKNSDIQNKRNIDQVIRDNVSDLPQSVTDTSVSGQKVYHVEDQAYDQHNYDQFKEYYNGSYQNTGCGLCAASYAMTLAGYPTTPDEAYKLSGNSTCTSWNSVANGHGDFSMFRSDTENITALAKQAKTEGNISPLIIRTADDSHYVVLKDIDMDSSGNVTKYYFFDPSGGRTIETSSVEEFKNTIYYGQRSYHTIDSFGYYNLN